MGDLAALATKWAQLGAGNTVAKLQTLNGTMVTGPTKDIDAVIVENFCINNNKLPALRSYLSTSAPVTAALLATNYLLAIIAGADGGQLKAASEPTLLGTLSGITSDARTGITAGNFTALLSVTTPQVPWWQANGFTGPIMLADLIAAGNLS